MMRRRFHPSGMMLHRYAESTLRPWLSLWVRRHLATCLECRALVSFTRSLPAALATLPPTVSLDSALVDRIIAERLGGERMVLPPADFGAVAVRRRGLLRIVPAVAAAILAVVVYRARAWSRHDTGTSAPSALTRQSSPASSDEFAVSEFFLPKSAFASEAARADSSVLPLTLDGTRLRPGVVRYSRFERVRGGARHRIGTESVELS